jgi:hypothetical protein
MALESEYKIIRELIGEVIAEIRKVANDVLEYEDFKKVSEKTIYEFNEMEYLMRPRARFELIQMKILYLKDEDSELQHARAVKFMLRERMFYLDLLYRLMVYLLSRQGAFNTKGVENPMMELKDVIYFL